MYPPFTHGSDGLIQARAITAGAGQTVVRVDVIFRHTQIEKGLPLGGQVLFVGGAAGISDEGIFHGVSVRIRPRFCKSFRTSYMR